MASTGDPKHNTLTHSGTRINIRTKTHLGTRNRGGTHGHRHKHREEKSTTNPITHTLPVKHRRSRSSKMVTQHSTYLSGNHLGACVHSLVGPAGAPKSDLRACVHIHTHTHMCVQFCMSVCMGAGQCAFLMSLNSHACCLVCSRQHGPSQYILQGGGRSVYV